MGCPEHRSGIPCSSSTVIANLEPPSSRKRSKTGKKGLFRPQNTLLGALEVLGRPRGPVFCPTATGWSSWVSRIHTMCLGPFRDLYGTPGAPKRVRFCPETPFWGPRRSFGSPQWPFRGPKRPKGKNFHFWGPFWPPLSSGDGREGPTGVQNTSTHCAWVGRIHITCLGSLTDLYGPQKGPFWPR